MSYTATIKNLTTNTIEHVTGEPKTSIDSVTRWASVQGKAGYSVIRKIGSCAFALVNDHTGERALLTIESSRVI